MVVAEMMKKPAVKISVSDSDTSSDDSEESDKIESEVEVDNAEADAGSLSSNDESASSNDNHGSDNELLVTNEGWADSVAKILGSSKPKNKKTLVLSRAKKHSEIAKKVEEKPAFEVIGESADNKTEEKKDVVKQEGDTEPLAKKKKHEKQSIRVKPSVLEKDREKVLNKIATKGVVQLFNAVRNQQKTLEKEIGRSDISEGKKEKILKKFDKRSFLDTLMGPTKSVVVDEVKPLKDKVKSEEKPRWSALRDDFMMGAKMKDWDKESVDD